MHQRHGLLSIARGPMAISDLFSLSQI